MAAEALQGQVTLEYPREGVRWSLDADAAATLKEATRDRIAHASVRAKKEARSKERRLGGTRGLDSET